jgi:hypothetical protein
MKKTLTTVVALLVVLCLASAGLAATSAGGGKAGHLEKQHVVMGTVTAIDKAKDEITVKNERTHIPDIIKVKADMIAKLKVGETVRIILEPNTNIVQELIVENKK